MPRPSRSLGPFSAAEQAALMDDAVRGHADLTLALPYWPDEAAPAGLAILAFAGELRSIADKVSDPMIGAMRAAFWDEVVAASFGEGTVREAPTAKAMAATLCAYPAARPHLEAMVDALRDALGPPEGPPQAFQEGERAAPLSASVSLSSSFSEALIRALASVLPEARLPDSLLTLIAASEAVQRAPASEPAALRAAKSALAAAWRDVTPIPPAYAPILAPLSLPRVGQNPFARRWHLFFTILRGR